MPTHPRSSKMDTLELSPKDIGLWRVPPFQRPVRQNAKVMAMAQALAANGGVIDGIITLGKLTKDNATYIVDGQHRAESFRISGIEKAYADVRICEFDSMASMADEFVRLNSSLVRMRPDDILRGCAPSLPNLKKITTECPFVGYDMIRRGTKAPILSMSMTLRCWSASSNETPSPAGSPSAQDLATGLTDESTEELIRFLTCAQAAWGRDPEYLRLWGALNLTLCMWLYRRLVLDRDRRGNKRHLLLNIKQFKSCLSSLSADESYLEYLVGRTLSDLHRSPCYGKIRTLWGRRLRQDEPSLVVKFPSAAWAS